MCGCNRVCLSSGDRSEPVSSATYELTGRRSVPHRNPVLESGTGRYFRHKEGSLKWPIRLECCGLDRVSLESEC